MLTKGTYSLTQPTINPLFKQTKQLQEILLDWTGNKTSYYDYLKANSAAYTSGASWNKVLHDGFAVGAAATVGSASGDFGSAASALSQSAAKVAMELILYTKTGLGDGQQANNPWLQEFPDPITRVSWDNYVTVSKFDADAKELVIPYIGCIGSKTKATRFQVRLRQRGYDEQAIHRLIMPIGLDIGCKQPMAVAVSIMAQILAFHH